MKKYISISLFLFILSCQSITPTHSSRQDPIILQKKVITAPSNNQNKLDEKPKEEKPDEKPKEEKPREQIPNNINKNEAYFLRSEKIKTIIEKQKKAFNDEEKAEKNKQYKYLDINDDSNIKYMYLKDTFQKKNSTVNVAITVGPFNPNEKKEKNKITEYSEDNKNNDSTENISFDNNEVDKLLNTDLHIINNINAPQSDKINELKSRLNKENDSDSYHNYKKFGVDNITSEPKLKRSGKLYVDNSEDNDDENSNKVTIIEARDGGTASGNYFSNIAKWFIKGIKLHYPEGKGLSSHTNSVIAAFLDTNSDFRVSDIELLGNEEENKNIMVTVDSMGITNTVKGIINLSYGNTNFTDNMEFISKEKKYIESVASDLYRNVKDYTTNLFTKSSLDEIDARNNNLKVVALGNENDVKDNYYESKNFSANILSHYQRMSPEIQQLYRSESIIVKNVADERKKNNVNSEVDDALKIKEENIAYISENNKIYYEGYYPQANPLLLRAFTVSANGFIRQGEFQIGSSFATPRVTRLAYELKKKFPFLSYQQIKQVILSTSDHDHSGYLSNSVGWGQINFQKAMKGPSDFNAGLIDEMKFFKGNYDKIYSTDENGNIKNRFFYVNIKDGQSFTFENNITSGLQGDGNSKEFEIIKIKGRKYDSYKNILEYEYRMPKVLDSEKLFYHNVAQAGLRKDGNGELILTGLQLYSAPSEILKGKLTLKNDSYSTTKVFEGAKFNIENDDSKISLQNIISDGEVNFNANTDIKNYIASSSSSTIFNSGKKVNAKNFKTTGKISLNAQDLTDFNQLKDILSVTDVNDLKNIKDENIQNLYLKPVIINQGKFYMLSFEFNYNYAKELKNLTDEELRNIPSYNYNEKKFFESYNIIDDSEKNSTFNKNDQYIINLKADKSTNKNDIKKNIFTDNYSSFIANIFDGYEIRSNNKDNLLSNNKKDRVFFNSYLNTKLFNEDKKFEPFKSNTSIFNFGISHNSIDVFVNYSKQDLNFKKSNFKNDIYGLNLNYNFNNFSTFNSISLNNTKIERKILDDNINNSLYSILFENEIKFSKNFDFDKFKINTSVFNNLSYLKLFNNEKENNAYGIKILNNNIIKDRIGASLQIDANIYDSITLQNKVNGSILINNDNSTLKANILGTDTQLIGKKLNKFNLDYNISINYLINDLSIKTYANINNKLQAGIGILLGYKY